MAVHTFTSADELRAAVGSDLGSSEWWEITQDRVDRFADATDDHQFIHVDPDKASMTPFGGTIAHGFLTLSMAVALTHQVMAVEGLTMAVNYGLNKVRFPAPVRVGSRLRARAVIAAVDDVPGGVQVEVDLTFEVEGGDKPVCVAQTVSRYYF